MRLNLSLGLDSALYALRPAWSPAQLFLTGAGGAFYSAHRGLFQDVAGTLPVTDPGQSVALMRDLSGRGNHATQPAPSQRPTAGRHPESGLRNLLPNNTPSGAALGVLGAGGALPTGWEISFAGGAAGTAEIIGIGGEYIDLRVVQTGSTGAPLLRPVTVGASIPTSQGDDWAFSISLAMIAGDLAGNGTPQLRGTERTDAGGFLASPSFLQPVPITSTLTRFGGTASIAHADTKKITPDFRVQSTGAWDATFRISLPQLERGTVATNTQIARKGGFDVTEAGQQSVHYLQPDGVDDWLSFSDVTQEYTYTLAAAHDLHDSATFDSSAGTIFGNAGTGNNRFFRGARNRINIFRQADNHRSVATQNLSGRVVDIARLSAEGSAGDYWRNDVKAATLAVDEGTVAPLTFNTLFRSGSSYATGRFYGAGLINHAVSVHDRIRLQQYLSDLAGVSP